MRSRVGSRRRWRGGRATGLAAPIIEVGSHCGGSQQGGGDRARLDSVVAAVERARRPRRWAKGPDRDPVRGTIERRPEYVPLEVVPTSVKAGDEPQRPLAQGDEAGEGRVQGDVDDQQQLEV